MNSKEIFSKTLTEIFSLIEENGGEGRLIGGCVRDFIISEPLKDIDIATTIKPEKLARIFRAKGYSVHEIGIKFGTILVIINSERFEITTLRQDIKCDGRHAVVEFTTDWGIDANRRDFTINSLSMDRSLKIYDYSTGIDDLKNRIVRFIGNPEDRIREDYLRIIRYFRFLARFGTTNIHQPSFNSCIALSHELSNISGERICDEMLKVVKGKYLRDVFLMVKALNFFEHIGLKNFEEARLDQVKFDDDIELNLAKFVFAFDLTKEEFNSFAKRWRLSKKQKKVVEILCFLESDLQLTDSLEMHASSLLTYGPEYYKKLLVFKENIENSPENYNKYIKLVKKYEQTKFPISGNDLISIGVQKDLIGKIILELKIIWIISDFNLSKTKLYQILNLS